MSDPLTWQPGDPVHAPDDYRNCDRCGATWTGGASPLPTICPQCGDDPAADPLDEAIEAATDALWSEHLAEFPQVAFLSDVVPRVFRPSAAAAVRAAAPIIVKATLASVSRPTQPLRRLAPEDYEDVADLRARLATAERDALLRAARQINEDAKAHAQLPGDQPWDRGFVAGMTHAANDIANAVHRDDLARERAKAADQSAADRAEAGE